MPDVKTRHRFLLLSIRIKIERWASHNHAMGFEHHFQSVYLFGSVAFFVRLLARRQVFEFGQHLKELLDFAGRLVGIEDLGWGAEAKSLAPDGTFCTCETRGLLKRFSVVAASRRYVGKETDRRWEEREELSLVEFKTVEYPGSKQVTADDELKQQILKMGIRKLERETGVGHHTIDRILKGENVR